MSANEFNFKLMAMKKIGYVIRITVFVRFILFQQYRCQIGQITTKLGLETGRKKLHTNKELRWKEK